MSETAFPINDLLRRKFQTALIIISLTSCVASTIFLILFSDKLGLGITAMVKGRLTTSFSTVFSQFIFFVAFLVFVVGAVIIAFMVFIMMVQRIRDIGLMKAGGCPNNMIFGYFITELLVISFLGCFLGAIFGVVVDYGATGLLSNLNFHIIQGQSNLWYVPLIFGIFFSLALILGAKPVLDITKIEPIEALSPSRYSGVTREGGFETGLKSGLTFQIALRSLARHKSATFRIVVCLSAVFLLATVGIAGGIIANHTTQGWIEKASGGDTILMAHKDVCNRYSLLLSKFLEANTTSEFNYLNSSYSITEEMLSQTRSMSNVTAVDPRLVLETDVEEVQGFILGSSTFDSRWIGDDRKGRSLIIGVYPDQVVNSWFSDGEFLKTESEEEAVLGDSLAQTMFDMPLIQEIKIFEADFGIVGVCIDPINNGNVTYVPIKRLQEITGVLAYNIVIIKLTPSANRTFTLSQIRDEVKHIDPEFDILDLKKISDNNLAFLGYFWSAIMLLPLFSLFAASLCLIAYVILTINEQKQELGILRALGAKPLTILKIVSTQSFIVLISSYAVGVAFGIMTILMILIPNPFVTVYTIMEITGWLLVSLAVIFLVSLYPAMDFSKKPILDIITQT